MGKLLYRVLAGRTSHELKVDSKGVPFVFQKLFDTVGMEDVSAGELHYWLSAKLACETDVAEVVL